MNDYNRLGWHDSMAYFYDRDTCLCGRPTDDEQCQQCGRAICLMCAELDGGFCLVHPNDQYKPPEEGE